VQSGKQCLCSYSLPTEFGKGIFSNYELNSEVTDLYSNVKITSIADAVEGRVNVTCSNGLVGCPYTLVCGFAPTILV
jgi:anaphase-promoting complex subunit 1